MHPFSFFLVAIHGAAIASSASIHSRTAGSGAILERRADEDYDEVTMTWKLQRMGDAYGAHIPGWLLPMEIGSSKSTERQPNFLLHVDSASPKRCVSRCNAVSQRQVRGAVRVLSAFAYIFTAL